MRIQHEDAKVGNEYYAFIRDNIHIRDCQEIYIVRVTCVKEKRRKVTETYINGELLKKDVEWEDEDNFFKIEEIVFSFKDNLSVKVGDTISSYYVYEQMSETFEGLRRSLEREIRVWKNSRYEYSTGKHTKGADKHIERFEKEMFILLKYMKDNSIVKVRTAIEDIPVEIPLEFYDNEFHKTSGTKYNTVSFDTLNIDNHDGFRCSAKEYSIVSLHNMTGKYYIVDEKPTTAPFYRESVMAKAVIPKGSNYFIDTNGEIVTNQIKLLYPFFDSKIKTKWFDELEDTEGIV